MGFFKNKSVVFKLILALCIGLVVFNLEVNTSYVMALSESEKEEHRNKHENEEPIKEEELTPSTQGVEEIKEYTYSDGCKKTVTKMDATTVGVATTQTVWTYNDDSVSVSAGNVTADDNTDDIERSEAAQGGQLLQPVVDLLLTLGDGIMDVIQRAVVGTDGHISIDIEISILEMIGMIIGIIFAVIAIAAVIIAVSSLGAWVTGLVSGIGWLANGIAATKGIATVVVAVGVLGAGLSTYSHTVSAFNAAFLPDITVLPTYSVSPEEIFEGKLLIFDVNFFKPKDLYVKLDNDDPVKIQEFDETTDTREVKYYFYYDNNHKEVPTSKQNTAMELSSVIAKWYYTIRNIALVVMMLVLVYVGIRMMLCSIASEKSKYKKMLGDWVISMCLVFVLHYIMVFAVNINESIVDLMEVATDKNQQAFELDLQDMGNRKGKFIDAVKEDPDLLECLYLPGDVKATEDNADQATLFMWPVNLTGRVRMMAQMQNGSSEYVGYAIAFLVLVFYTVFFAFTYLKRVLYLAFLTVIAPLVAMTYPIDKISDGKAQAFNMWLKEYIFNLLIQPVHLLLYMLLISMAIDLASQNIIYTLVAIGFMMPAEKLIRSMFGFEKAKTPGFLGGAAGAAVAMGAMTKLAKIGGGSKGGNKKAEKLDKSKDDSDDIDSGKAPSAQGFRGLNVGESGSENDDDEGPQMVDGANNSDEVDSLNAEQQSRDNGGADENTDSDTSIDFYDTEEPKNYFDSPEEYDEWLDLAMLPDEDRTEEGEARREELEAKAQSAKDARLKRKQPKFMLDEARRKEEEQRQNSNRFKRVGAVALNKAKKIKESVGNAVDNANYNAKQAGKKAIKNLPESIGKTFKSGVKLTGLGVGAGFGAAATIASGEVKSLPQNIALGATAGKVFGGAVGDLGENVVKSYKDASTEWKKDNWSDERKEEERHKRFIENEEKRKFYERKNSERLKGLTGAAKQQEIDQIMEDAYKYNREGIQDDKLIAKAMNLNKDKPASDSSIAAALLANRGGKDIEGIEKYRADLTELYGEKDAKKVIMDAKKIQGLI